MRKNNAGRRSARRFVMTSVAVAAAGIVAATLNLPKKTEELSWRLDPGRPDLKLAAR
jgi:hypothetical protein